MQLTTVMQPMRLYYSTLLLQSACNNFFLKPFMHERRNPMLTARFIYSTKISQFHSDTTIEIKAPLQLLAATYSSI